MTAKVSSCGARGWAHVNVPPAYAPVPATFNGTSQTLTKNTVFTGVSDSKKGFLALRFKVVGGDGSYMVMYGTGYINAGVQNFAIYKAGSDNKLGIRGSYSAVKKLDIKSTIAFTTLVNTGWHSLIVTFDMAVAGSARLYIDNVDALEPTGQTFIDSLIDFTGTGSAPLHAVALDNRNGLLAGYWDGCLSEIVFANEYIDISNASLRSKIVSSIDVTKFNDPGIGATNWGLTSAPVILTNDFDSIEINNGGGGDMTVNSGPLTSCA